MTKTIYMPWIAVKLREKGFEIIKVKPNPRKPQFDCYEFQESEELETAITEIMKQ